MGKVSKFLLRFTKLLEPEKKVSHWAIAETHVLLGEKHDRIIVEYAHGQTLIQRLMNVPIIILRRVIKTENKNNDAKCITYLVFLAKSHPVLLFRSISEKIVS